MEKLNAVEKVHQVKLIADHYGVQSFLTKKDE